MVNVQVTFLHLLGLLPCHMTLKLGLFNHMTCLSDHVTLEAATLVVQLTWLHLSTDSMRERTTLYLLQYVFPLYNYSYEKLGKTGQVSTHKECARTLCLWVFTTRSSRRCFPVDHGPTSISFLIGRLQNFGWTSLRFWIFEFHWFRVIYLRLIFKQNL